ncbi:MAG: hypothetical protein JSS07_02770 [Proteobacteria bacterium]|nr:hypothetical protein [Pseudomonadota bacterium]
MPKLTVLGLAGLGAAVGYYFGTTHLDQAILAMAVPGTMALGKMIRKGVSKLTRRPAPETPPAAGDISDVEILAATVGGYLIANKLATSSADVVIQTPAVIGTYVVAKTLAAVRAKNPVATTSTSESSPTPPYTPTF